MGHTIGHRDVLRSGHPAEAAGLWHVGVIPNKPRTQCCVLIAPIRFSDSKPEIFMWEI